MLASTEDRQRPAATPGVVTGRLALFGLAAVLLFLSGFAVWSAGTTFWAATAVRQAAEISDAFFDAQTAVSNEESLERKYRLEPSPAVRARHAAAAEALLVALERVRVSGDAADLRLVDGVFALHGPYLDAIDRMFVAVDAGDAPLVLQIDGGEVDPLFDDIQKKVSTAAEDHDQVAFQQLDRLARVESRVLVTTPIIFAIGIGAVIFFALVLRSYRRQAERAVASEAANIRLSEQRFRSLVQNASDVVLVCASGGLVTYQSPRAESAWQIAPGALLGSPLFGVVKAGDRPALRALFRDVETNSGTAHTIELEMNSTENEWRYCEIVLSNLIDQPGIHGIVATVRDVTERRAFEQELKQRAFYDPLTKLANRALFSDRLEQSLTHDGKRVGLLFIDLDHFKLVNDSLSHHAGDQLLVEAAARLRQSARSTDTIARLGGDEFVLLIPDLNSDQEAVQIADRVVRQFAVPFHIRDREVVVTASVGVAIGQAATTQSETLLRNADTAMYHAKSLGKGRQVLFEASMHIDDMARLELEDDLRRAIHLNELQIYYQPIVHFPSLQIEGVEALVRWQHPARGLLTPGAFIPMAEETGLISALGLFVLQEASRQVAIWQGQFPRHARMTVSVNLSAKQFQNPGLVTEVAHALAKSGLPAVSLRLEITESATMRDVEGTIAKLRQLRQMGVHLAVDDFGTGYSSLAYLKRLPIHVLKIDQSFIQGIVEDQEDAAIVRTIISLAKSLDLKVIAEGVETAAQASLLEAWECDRGQGFYFSHPADAGGIETMLALPAPFEQQRTAA